MDAVRGRKKKGGGSPISQPFEPGGSPTCWTPFVTAEYEIIVDRPTLP
jgi:hypothetical protein